MKYWQTRSEFISYFVLLLVLRKFVQKFPVLSLMDKKARFRKYGKSKTGEPTFYDGSPVLNRFDRFS